MHMMQLITRTEFRFTLPSEYSKIKSFSFSYRVLDYGEGVWAGGVGESEPEAWHSMIQLKDNGCHGYEFNFNRDDKWHKATFNVADWNIGDVTTNLSDIIIKFVDLRGHIMISDLSVEQALTVTLKNVNADGTTSTASVFEGQLPEVPTMEGKKFAGWYDEDGNKVTGVDKTTTTLVARWSVSKFTDYNEKTAWSDQRADYGTLADCDGRWEVRSSDRADDIAAGHYPDDEGSAAFHPTTTDDASMTERQWAGLELTPFDFSKVNSARFTIGFRSPLWMGFYINGVNCGNLTTYKGFYNYEIVVTGKNAAVHNNCTGKDYTVALTDEMYNGTKGIELKATAAGSVFMHITQIVEDQLDYVATCKKIEASLPDTPNADGIEKTADYKNFREYFNDYENESYPVSEKMTNWMAKLPVKVLGSSDTNRALDRSGAFNINESHYNFVFNGVGSGIGSPAACNLDKESWVAYVGDISKSYGCVAFPNVNFSKYARVEFYMGFGGNEGGGIPKYAMGLLSADKVAIDDLPSSSSFIGNGVETKGNGWNTATDLKVTVSDGKINFKATNIDKTMDLTTAIYNGTSALAFSVTGVTWEYFIISSFTGYYL